MPIKKPIKCSECGRELGFVVMNGHIWEAHIKCMGCGKYAAPIKRVGPLGYEPTDEVVDPFCPYHVKDPERRQNCMSLPAI